MQKTTMLISLAVVAALAMPTGAAPVDLYQKNYELLVAPFEEMAQETGLDLDVASATVRTESGYGVMSMREAIRGQGAYYADHGVDVELIRFDTAAEQGSWPLLALPTGGAYDLATSYASAHESSFGAGDQSADTTASCAGSIDEKRVGANPLSLIAGRSSVGGFSQNVTWGIITTTGEDDSLGNNAYAGSYSFAEPVDDYIAYGGGVYTGGSPTTVLGGFTYDFYCWESSGSEPGYCHWSCVRAFAYDYVTFTSATQIGGYINDDENLSALI